MPTGYTACIEDNEEVTLNEFVWRCVGAFDIWTRDHEGISPLRRQSTADTYTKQSLKESKKEEQILLKKTDQELEAEATLERAKHLKQAKKSLQRTRELDKRYARMKVKVEAWKPPTAEHEPLKKYMLEQLATHRPMAAYYEKEIADLLAPLKFDAEAYRAERLKWLREDIARDERDLSGYSSEADRMNTYMAELHRSVPRPGT